MYLLFDIGGTKMRMAVSFDAVNLQEVKIVMTPYEFNQALKIIKEYIQVADSSRAERVACVGLPGVLDDQASTLVSAPHLPNWVGKPIEKELTQILGSNVYLKNDADLAGLGEASFGSGKGYRIIAFITIGTGVGGVRIVDGEIDENRWGFEPGHQILSISGFESLNQRKYLEWEQMISGSSILAKYKKSPEEIKDPNFWENFEEWLALGLNNTIVYWSPEVVILGGGLMKINDISLERVQEKLNRFLKVFPQKPQIKRGKLSDLAGLYGALHFLKKTNKKIID